MKLCSSFVDCSVKIWMTAELVAIRFCDQGIVMLKCLLHHSKEYAMRHSDAQIRNFSTDLCPGSAWALEGNFLS